MKKRIFSLLLVCAMLLSLLPTMAFAEGTLPVATVAKIGDVEYTTLAAALIAARSGDTITVLAGTYGAEQIGKLDESGSYTNANSVRHKSLTIEPAEGATVKFTSDVSLGYDDSSTANATMTVKGFTFENASLSLSNYVQATVEDCTFSGSGNAAGALVINDSCCTNHKTTGEYPASQVTVKNCTIGGTDEGKPGIRLRNSGNVTLENNTVKNAKHNGILFESNGYIDNAPVKTISVTENKITEWNAGNESGGGRAIRLAGGGLAANSTITIKDNYFTKETLGLDTPDFMKITGVGSATVDLDHNYWNNKILTAVNGKSDLYTVDGATPTINTVISNATGVAKIGTVEYATLQDAVNAAETNNTITLLKDVNNGDGVKVPSDKNFTLDFDNHTYTVTQKLAGSEGTESQCFQLLKNSTLTFKNGTIKANNDNVAMIIQNYSNLTLENMLLYGASITRNDATIYTMSNNCGNVVIKDTKINTVSNGVAFDVYGGFGNYSDVTVTVTGSSEINGKIEVARGSGTQNKNTLAINGGTINGELAVTDNEKTEITITGGLFSAIEYVDGEDTYKIEDYVATGYACVANTDYSTKAAYPYVVKPVQIEMTKNVTAEGDKVKVGGEEINLTLTKGEGATSEPTAGQAKTVIAEVLDNTNVSTFADTNIDKATPATAKVEGKVDGFDLSMVLNAVKEAAAAKSGITSSVTADDTIGVQVSGQEAKTFTDADVTKTISIDLTAATVTTTQEAQTVVSLSTTTFEVKPIATIVVDKGNGETETIKAVIPNDAITAPITFRLPVPSNWTGSVTVYHENAYYTTCAIQGEGDNQYIELASQKFSYWTVENNEFEDDEAVAKTGNRYYNNLAEALNDAANGDTVTVLKNCTLNSIVTISDGRSITLDLAGYTVENANDPAINVTHGKVTVKDGTIKGTNDTSKNTVFKVYGSDNASDAAYSTLTLTNVTVDAPNTWYPAMIGATANKHSYGAEVTMTGSTLKAKSGIYVNGNIQDVTGENLPKVTLTNTKITSIDNAIYAAGYAKWDIDNSTITGATGIYAKAGTFDIVGGKIEGNGAYAAPAPNGNGADSTGDGIIMDSKTGYAGNMTMNLNGVTVRSVNGNAVHEALTDKTTTSTQSIAITGGSFTAAVGKEAVVTSEAFDRADSTTLTVAGTPTGVTAQTDLGKFTSFNVNYGDGISYGDFSSFLNAAGSVTISDKVNFATMKAGQKLIANFDVTMGTVSYKTGSMSEFKTIHSGDALDGVANDTAITFQIECGRTVTNTFTFTPHWESVEIPYNLAVKPISGDTVALTVGTDSANYVEYGVYASVPNGTSTMAIGSYNFELNYDTTAFDFESFTAADSAATVEVNSTTAGKANVGVTLNAAVTPESVAEGAAPTYANTALLGTLKLKVKSNSTTTTGTLKTTFSTGAKVTPKGYDNNNATITTKDHIQYLISFEYVGATGDASAWVLSGKEPSMPTATPKIGWSAATTATGEGWNPETPATVTGPVTYHYTAHHDQYTVTWNGETNPMTVTKTVYGTGGTETVTSGGTMYYEDTLTITVTGLADKTVIRNGDFKYKLGETAAVGVSREGDTGFTYKVGPSVVNANVVLSYTPSEYVTVTFSGGDAVELKNGESAATALDAITLKGTADKLYASVDDFIKGNDGVKYVIPTQVPKENARLVPPEALTDYTKQSWKIANVTEPVANSTLNASPASYVFTADTTLTADAVNTHKVTFSAGNGSFVTDPAQVIEYRVDAGTPIENILTFGSVANKTVYDNSEGTPKLVDEPKVVPVNGYKFDKWQPSATGNLAGDITITAQYAVAKYNISVSDNATFKGLTGADATGKISMENNVTFKLMLKKNTRIDSVSYTVASGANGTTYEGATNVPLTADANGVYTIPKANILGDVTVTVQTVNTVKVTVKSADTSKGTVGGTTAFVVDKDSNVSAWNYDALTTAAEPGYEVKKNEDGKIIFYTKDGESLTAFSAETFTADTTLYVNFVDATYDFAATEGLVTTGNGITNNKVTRGTNANFTVNSINNIITSVTYSVEGGVQNVLLQPGTDDSYTIPGDRIIGKVTVTVKTLAEEANIDKPIKALFILRDGTMTGVEGSGAYMANVVQNSNMKILALVSEAFKATDYAGTSKFFQLANGTQLYWSDRYDAYVCWVSKDMKAADLNGFVKFDGTKTATAIVNEGDINFDGSVDSADAGIVNDALHGTRQVPTSALQLFEMDVANTSGKSYVNGATIDANDVTWILQKTVGKTVAKADNPL